MDSNIYKTLREAAIERVLLKDIKFLYAKSTKRTSDTKGVKGSYYFLTPIVAYTEDDRTLNFECLVKFVPRRRDFFVWRVFDPAAESGLLDKPDSLTAHLEESQDGRIYEHLNARRIGQIRQFVVELFQKNDNWMKGQKLVSYNNDYGQVSIITIAPVTS